MAWKHQAERIEEVHARSRLFAKLFECRARFQALPGDVLSERTLLMGFEMRRQPSRMGS